MDLTNSLFGAAGVLGALTYLLFFLLLLAANIALWKYIFRGGKHCCHDHGDWREKGRDKGERR